MNSLTIASPAKLNLFLRVIGRYPDGYHKIETLFHRISLKDTLQLVKKDKGFSLRCSDPALSVGEDNLITRAYRLLQSRFPKLGGVSVYLTKRIPLGGGLGGGSSNAAFFLLGMKKLFGLPLEFKEMLKMGKKLGADVPFFLYKTRQALGKGRGDKIFPRPGGKRKWFLLVLFKKGLSTKKVYQNCLKTVSPSLTKVSRAVRMGYDVFQNDLEPSAVLLNPKIQKIIDRIFHLGVPWVRMSGSGPTVFAVLSHQTEAERVGRKLKPYLSTERIIVCHSF